LRGISKILVPIISLMVVFTAGGCSGSEYQRSLYKDDSKIISQSDSYSFKNRLENASNGKVTIRFGSFYGMDTLFTIEASKEAVAPLELDSKVDSGDFKVVLISPDNKVEILAEGTKSAKQEFKLQKGKSRIKIVGNNAKGEVKLNIKDNENIKIKQG
jgi:hypothetical protein